MSRILFSLLLSLSYNCLQANIRDLLLSDKQYDSVIFLVNNAKLNESVEVELRKNQENDPSLKMLTFSDILKVYNLIKPVNFKTYKDSLVQYNICKKLAVGLAEKVINDISSETANQKIPLSRYLNFEKGIYFKNNLTYFFQNQIFDFYFNNKVINYLNNSEYLELLKPLPLYKLLSDTKTEQILLDEILFIANNSKFKLLINE
jgi:hypothetical protein